MDESWHMLAHPPSVRGPAQLYDQCRTLDFRAHLNVAKTIKMA